MYPEMIISPKMNIIRLIEKIKLWKDHNSLRTTQPIIFCDPENGWNDIITGNILKRTSKIARF